MPFTSKDRQTVDELAEQYLCSNLANWLDLDQVVEVAFEVHLNRKNLRKSKNRKKRTQKKQ